MKAHAVACAALREENDSAFFEALSSGFVNRDRIYSLADHFDVDPPVLRRALRLVAMS